MSSGLCRQFLSKLKPCPQIWAKAPLRDPEMMNTYSPKRKDCLRIVSPPDWELTPRRMEDFLVNYHLVTNTELPDESEWETWMFLTQQTLLNQSDDFKAFILIGPEENDPVRGMIVCEPDRLRTPALPEVVHCIYDFMVLPKWQGRGYGSFLLRRAENFYRHRGKHCIYVASTPCAVPWYQRKGYSIFNCPPIEPSKEPEWRKEGWILLRKDFTSTSCPRIWANSAFPPFL